MKTRLPFISVVVPAFNEEKYIGLTLDSLRRQEYPKEKFELIVSDDKSTDKTAEVARKYGAKVVFCGKHRIGANRNNGARASSKQAEIIAFVDADAVVPPQWLRAVARAFRNERVVLVQGPVQPASNGRPCSAWMRLFLDAYFKLMIAFGMPSGPGSNYCVRKSAFNKVGGFPEDAVTGEDLALAKKLLKHGKAVFADDAFLYVSDRRVRKWGVAKYLWFHLSNSLRFALSGKASEEYENVR
ncbi:MAG: glycosyltransferase [Candidatus Micrarchaeia archaeon]